MRDEMIGAVVRRAIEHPEFREHLLSDPDAALSRHGFALEDEELREIRKIHDSVTKSEDVEQKLVSIAREYGISPARGDTERS